MGETHVPPADVVVGVLTFRREAQLRRLLPLLLEQCASVDPPALLLVVDNDPDASARDTVAAHPSTLYVHEPAPGIAAARNRVLDVARGSGAAAVAFIDDDETPSDRWLATLVEGWRRWRCAAVSGPRVFEFEGPVDAWVERCGFFRRRTHPTGTLRPGAATANLLLDLVALEERGLRFDDRFGLTGGEDTFLTRSLVARGGEIRWVDEAVVHEWVPVDRATREWVLDRHRRTGAIWARVQLELAGPGAGRIRSRARMGLRASVRLVLGALALLLSVLSDRSAARVAAEEGLATAFGGMEGLHGRQRVGYGAPTP